MRYAVVDLQRNLVVNVVEVEPEDGSKPESGFLLLSADSAKIGDGWNGKSVIPQPEPPFIPRG